MEVAVHPRGDGRARITEFVDGSPDPVGPGVQADPSSPSVSASACSAVSSAELRQTWAASSPASRTGSGSTRDGVASDACILAAILPSRGAGSN
ncbi:MAG: hypothetical protein ACXWZF_10465, partial [Actinomycetota bacterium]